MRILILNGGYLSPVPSGGDRHLLALAAALAEHPEIESIAFYAPKFVARWLPKGVAGWFYPGRPPRSTPEAALAYALRFLRVSSRLIFDRLSGTRSEQAKLVLTSPALVDLIPAFLHRLICGSRVGVFAFHVGDVRAVGRPRRGLQAALAWLASWPAMALLRRADRVMTSTDVVLQHLVELGVERKRLIKHLPIVAVEAVRNAAAESSVQPVPDVLFVGRWVERKGVFDLIEAARRSRLSFALVGAGEEADALAELIESQDLSGRVRLLGPLADEEIYATMRAAGVLALPSYEEGYGLVIAEALVAGTPAVAYALPHYAEVFSDALVQVPKGDVAALVRELERLVRVPAQADPPAVVMTAEVAAQEIVEHFQVSERSASE